MKKLSILILLLVYIVLNTQAQTHLLGPHNRNNLQEAPYSEWFNDGYETYTPSPEIINQLKAINTKDYSIKIFMATWCSDSHREVPRLLKVLDTTGFSPDRILMIGLDNSDSLYKRSPTHEDEGLHIYRVPTFIVYKKGVEVNRIVEFPVLSLERDLLTLFTHEEYSPNYRSYPYLIKWLNNGLLADDNISYIGLANQIKHLLRSASELNSFGYVLLKQGDTRIKEALKVFQMNYYLYPENFPASINLIEANYKSGKQQDAINLIKRTARSNNDPENINYLFDLYDKVREKTK